MSSNLSKKKEILLIYYRLFKPGGVTKTMVNLANELVNYHNVTILLLINNNESYFELDPRVKIITINTFKHIAFSKGCVFLNTKLGKKIPKRESFKSVLYDYGAYRVLSNWLKLNNKDYDVIITCLYKLSAYLSVNNKLNNKLITWEKNSYEGVNSFWRLFPKYFYIKNKGVVTLNNQGYNYYKTFNNNVHKIYNITGSPYEENNSSLINEKNNEISFVGRLSKEKNVDHIIDIFSRLNSDYKLNIIGDGELRNELENKVKSLNLNNVTFYGVLKPKKVNDILLKSKILLLTSSTEGLPNVLVEGMMTGNVLVSYNCKYGPDEIINENNGYLINLFDKDMMYKRISDLISDEDKLLALCQNSFLESKKWKKELLTSKWLQLINDLDE
jgi:GalNAc-alpha-(1->4)-GalNAc-alpha-(1->3)-diNAcBac-PP-undecaprenol alpha-1,4-N-acetyl-D-galactosaminyltransferase